jgi:molecular chaperone DnaJ
MNLKEAYELLELDQSCSDDELKAKLKTLAKKYHPDVYKEDPDKFKKINSAYQLIEKYRKEPPNPFGRVAGTDTSDFPFEFNINDIFSNFNGFTGFRQGPPGRTPPPIRMTKKISFQESVLGTEVSVSVKREVKCPGCDGKGFAQKKNDCAHCDGYGTTTTKQGNFTFNSQCSHCKGKGDKEDCKKCNKKGFILEDTNLNLSVPPGIMDGNIMQITGGGHFIQKSVFGDSYGDMLITINVENTTQLSLVGADVVYTLPISLLEGIRGCTKTVPTVNGEMEISVKPGSRNKEELIIPQVGVAKRGNQRVIFDVSYPEAEQDIQKITDILDKKEENVSH